MPESRSALRSTSTIYIIDRMPIPVCRRARAKRCTNVRGAQYAGKCDAKAEPYFGWKLHLICDSAGISVRHGLRLVPPHHPMPQRGGMRQHRASPLRME